MNRIVLFFIEKGIRKLIILSISYCYDYLYDRKYKLDIYSHLPKDKLRLNKNELKESGHYQQTNIFPLRKLFRALAIPKGKNIIDIGSGKGRVLLIASEFGFKKAIGVEISKVLHDISEKNIKIYKTKKM